MNRTSNMLALAISSLALVACAPQVAAQPEQSAAYLPAAQPRLAAGAPSAKLQLSSPDIQTGHALRAAQVAHAFGCASQNVSPQLDWSGVPSGTQSFVLTMYDPDAPTGNGFFHWVVYNLPATSTGLQRGAGSTGTLPRGAGQMNDAGMSGYLGACPPAGDKPHRYIFTLYALSEPLNVAAGSSAALIGFSMSGKVLAKASLITFYGR